MQKAYNRIFWKNKPSLDTPLNEADLNRGDAALDVIDDRVISLDTVKFDKAEAQGLFKDVSLNRSNGVITFTLYNGATKTIDTLLEKIAVNFDYDPVTQRLIITLDDGEKKYIDLSALITQYEFLDSDTIDFQLQPDGKVTAIVKEGSIEEKHLRPNYLADIKVEIAKAEASRDAAKASEIAAKASEDAAAASAQGAADSAAAALASEQVAALSEQAATQKATDAAASAATSAEKAEQAAESASTATQKATEASDNAAAAEASKTAAETAKADAEAQAELSKSYAVGTDNVTRRLS